MASYEHGYDEMFVDTPPEYLRCAICRFILRDPVQVVQCGHQFCCCCFDRLKENSLECPSDLFCPLDGRIVDCGRVIKDKFTERIISDLHVYCRYKDHGCNWNGDLRNFNMHNSECSYALKAGAVNEPPQGSDGANGRISTEVFKEIVLKQVFSRLSRCEEALVDKDKDIAYLKFNLREANEMLEKREREANEKLEKREREANEKLEKREREAKKKLEKHEREVNEKLEKREKEANEKLERHEEEIAFLKEKMLFADGRMERLTKEIGKLKTENKLRKEEMDIVGNELIVLKEEIKNEPSKLGGADERSLTAMQCVNYISETNVHEWGRWWSIDNQDECMYSEVFYCNSNNFPCQVVACRKRDGRMEITFKPQNVTDFPNGTIFNISLDGSPSRSVFEENLCNRVVTYEQRVGYLLLLTMHQHEYQRYAGHFGSYCNMKCTWSYKIPQNNNK